MAHGTVRHGDAAAPASAIFGREKAAPAADAGAPIAQSIDVRVYRGIPYTGTLAAIDREGGEVSFAIAEQPSKGTVTLDGETFVYTSAKNKTGADRFTYTATDAAGSTSAPAEVRITIVRAKCGVTYDDMAESAAYTAAVDLAEHGVFVGTQVGSRRFFEPDRAVSRGEFVTMALACAGIPAGDLTMTGFCDDAEIPTWAKGSAVSALQCGLIRGVGTEGGMAFCADEGVTLSEAATVLNRLLRVTDVDLSDYDAGSADAWSAQAVANLESVRVIESGSFSAGDWQRPLTRGEAAQLLSAAMTLAEKKQETSFGLIPMTRRKAAEGRLSPLAERPRRVSRPQTRKRYDPFSAATCAWQKTRCAEQASNCPLSADNRGAERSEDFSKKWLCHFFDKKGGGRPPFFCL